MREARQTNIAEALKKHNDASHLKGETLPESQQVYRVKVATCFLRAGVPPSAASELVFPVKSYIL